MLSSPASGRSQLPPHLHRQVFPAHSTSQGAPTHYVPPAWTRSEFLLSFFSCPVLSNSLQPDRLQHARPPCPPPSPRACPSSHPLHPWCRSAISSSGALVSFCHWSFPASGTFPMSCLFTSGSQNIGSFSLSISPSNEYSRLISLKTDWFDLLAVQGTFRSLLQHHSSKASVLWHSAFFTVQLSQLNTTSGDGHSLDYTDLCWQSDVSAFQHTV